MIKFIGFTSLKDYLTSLICFKNSVLIIFAGLFGATFQNNFWSNPQQILFLFALLILDLITGILQAIKTKTFTSTKLPRWAGISFTYCLLLFVSFNLAKYSPIFSWLPSSLYAVFCGTLFVSLVENLNKLGLVNIQIYDWLSKKVNSTLDSQTKNNKSSV